MVRGYLRFLQVLTCKHLSVNSSYAKGAQGVPQPPDSTLRCSSHPRGSPRSPRVPTSAQALNLVAGSNIRDRAIRANPNWRMCVRWCVEVARKSPKPPGYAALRSHLLGRLLRVAARESFDTYVPYFPNQRNWKLG